MSKAKKALCVLGFSAVFVLGLLVFSSQAQAVANITGKIIRTDGTPIEDLYVYANKESATFSNVTDVNGDFNITITGASITGNYIIKPSSTLSVSETSPVANENHSVYFFPQTVSNISVTDGAITANVNFSLLPRGMISGKVTDQSGAAIDDAYVYAINNNNSNL